jgi:hypothetical protein
VSEAQLGILNYLLLALLYVFFARVLWAVWSEVKGPRHGTARTATANGASTAAPVNGDAPTIAVPSTGTMPAPAPTPAGGVVIPQPGSPEPLPTGRKARKRIPTHLKVIAPKVRKGSKYPIDTEITLGRGLHCTISLADDTYASQLHTRVFHRSEQVWVDDLGSTNGTHVNGARITRPVAIVKGDRVQVGSTIFEADR